MKTNSKKPNFVPTFQAIEKDKQEVLVQKFMLSHNLNVLHQITDYVLQHATDVGILNYFNTAIQPFIAELDIALDDYLNKPVNDEK